MCFLTEQVDDAVIVTGIQLDQVFEEQDEAAVNDGVVEVLGLHLKTVKATGLSLWCKCEYMMMACDTGYKCSLWRMTME